MNIDNLPQDLRAHYIKFHQDPQITNGIIANGKTERPLPSKPKSGGLQGDGAVSPARKFVQKYCIIITFASNKPGKRQKRATPSAAIVVTRLHLKATRYKKAWEEETPEHQKCTTKPTRPKHAKQTFSTLKIGKEVIAKMRRRGRKKVDGPENAYSEKPPPWRTTQVILTHL